MRDKYGGTTDEIRRRMAVTSTAFDRMYQTVADRNEEQQKEMHGDMHGTETRLKAIDNVSVLLHEIFSTHGDDLEFGFIGFMYGGQMQFMIPMDTSLKELVDDLAIACRKANMEMGAALREILAGRSEIADIWEDGADDEAG